MKHATGPISTRDAILVAADRLLGKYGYKKMTIEDLANEVGIGKGSVYLHFESKEEIALSHVDSIIERLKDNLRQIAAADLSVKQRLADMLVARVIYRFDSVQHYSQSLNELLSALRTKLLDRRRKYFEQEAALIAEVISEGQDVGVFRSGDARDIAKTFLSATNSLLPYSLSAYELGERAKVEERTRKTADILIRGISK